MDRNDVQIIKTETPYQGFFAITIYTFTRKKFDGTQAAPVSFEIFDRRPVVAILLHDPARDTVLLVEQCRTGALAAEKYGEMFNPYLLGCVAGIIDEGETPEQAASREIEEEVGLQVSNLQFVRRLLSSAGGCNEVVHLFLVETDLSQAQGIFGKAKENEDIRVHVLNTTDAYRMEENGEICTASAMYLLQWLKNKQRS